MTDADRAAHKELMKILGPTGRRSFRYDGPYAPCSLCGANSGLAAISGICLKCDRESNDRTN